MTAKNLSEDLIVPPKSVSVALSNFQDASIREH